jgi:hypothetical protein
MTDTIAISTQSHVMAFPFLPNPDPFDPSTQFAPPASVTINGGPDLRGQMVISPSLLHLIIFDSTQPLTSPSAIVYNRCIWNPDNNWEAELWYSHNDELWDYTHNLILAQAGLDDVTFLMATSGFDAGMVPTGSFATFLFSCGAGPQLQQWIKHVPGGSGASPPQQWITTPANYIFMGASGTGFGQGFGEKFEIAPAGQQTLTSTLTISTAW